MIRLILLVIIGILVLSFFGISLRALVHAPLTQENFSFVWQLLQAVWHWLVAKVSTLSGSVHQYTATL